MDPRSSRPDPEELLRRIQAEEGHARSGKLKVFLGYAPRVGKSYRMLDEGRRRKERGEDVVVGAVQAKGSEEIQHLLEKLEIVPLLREQHGGRSYEVMDLAALFRRHPEVCLVDELAYDNPPGSRNAKRWMDVKDLLDRGISVITAVNVQHVDEQQDKVEQVTGKRADQSVPGSFLREADEIVLVDAAPDELAGRHGEGATGSLRDASEMRELALLLVADVVDKQLQGYLECHGLPQTWGVHERILVCLTPRSNAAEMLASGKRNADRFHGALLACYVEQEGLSEEDCRLVAENLNLARESGAEIHRLNGSDFVDVILAFAREQRITQLFAGHTLVRHRPRFVRSAIDRLLDEAEEFDVRLFPHLEAQ